MPQFTQKYAIVQLLEDIPESTGFSSNNWPLHSTIVDTFAINWNVPTMVEKLTTLLSNHAPATSTAAEDKFLGPEKQIHVVLLEKIGGIVKLHYDVIELLEQGGLKLNDPQFAREDFLPHSTVRPHARLHKDDTVTFDALSIIDMFPHKNPYQRKVLKTIKIFGQ